MKSIYYMFIFLMLLVTACNHAIEISNSKEIPVVMSGWNIYIAGNYRYGPSIILNSDGSIDAWFAAAGGTQGKYLYPDSSSNTAVQLSGNMTASQMFTATESFYSVGILCPTWGTTNGGLTLSLYQWNTDYNTTILKGYIATKTFIGFADNSFLTISNNNLLPAGNYLWVLSQPQNTVGVWKYSGNESGTQSYLNGIPITGSYAASLFPNSGIGSFWDQIAYRRSTDGGKTWTTDQMVLKPTMGSRDQLSVCDPGVAEWGGYYYLGYTSTENQNGTNNQAYICRSTSPSGPWEKWNGSGWGGDKPQPIISYTGDSTCFGAGEPRMVLYNSKIFFYYSWDAGGSEAVTTRVATADENDENWPAHLTFHGTAINKTGIPGSDRSDIKYRDDLKKFQAINAASRMSPNSYIVLWESSDGFTFTQIGEFHNQLKPYLHNCGWSGDANGHIDPNKQQYLSYAYGPTWAAWNTFWQPLEY